MPGRGQGAFDMNKDKWAPAAGASGTSYRVSAEGGEDPPLTADGNEGEIY
jgi:hypothetical protein